MSTEKKILAGAATIAAIGAAYMLGGIVVAAALILILSVSVLVFVVTDY